MPVDYSSNTVTEMPHGRVFTYLLNAEKEGLRDGERQKETG